jgi:hypothetical protein
MKRIIIFVVGVMLVPAGADAQTADETIGHALAAAPARARDGAAVISWNDDYTYETLKEGTNRLVCYDRSGEPGRQPFAVQCTSVGNLERVAQTRRFEVESANDDELRAMLDAAESDGTRVAPEYASIWISMNGPDQASARSHTTVAVPGATTETTGFPGNGNAGGAWIMAVGTTSAHLMTPGR